MFAAVETSPALLHLVYSLLFQKGFMESLYIS